MYIINEWGSIYSLYVFFINLMLKYMLIVVFYLDMVNVESVEWNGWIVLLYLNLFYEDFVNY